ncbi:YtxH domain-containing protein [bacterium]|nr:MAG: YtxH domain-containing protein [bacterium]
MSERNGGESFLAGFLIGGVIGAGIALLFAPAKGEETREFIKTHATKAIDEGRTEIDKIQQVVREEVGKVLENKEVIRQAIQKGIEAFKSRGESVSENIDESQEEVD